ncbi:hypothetical protein PHYPSEUDO_013255 [Phytophthora pseudosyringae]|uniref:Uncharacterized protein n=1 Tax=Phytophthora pseudosyringae TaxID=221518 RepID=A0A8T1W748_9STRA|nr:hypothetical protein PHYPSEUDO_013255 [Phytophthora pseudosyringae]
MKVGGGKYPPNGAHKQQQEHQVTHQNDRQWAHPIDAVRSDAFDVSSSPKAFCDAPQTPAEPCAALQIEQRMADVVTSMGFHCASMWEPAGPKRWGLH